MKRARVTIVATFAAAASLLAGARAARAETRRVAVVVGQNVGAATETPLHYAETDAVKVADVLTEVGEVDPAHLFLVRGAHRDTLRAAFERAAAAVTAMRGRPDDRTLLIFYYSGHSDGDELQLGAERVTGDELRGWLRATGADVRVAVVDGCKSGAMIGKKGGAHAPAFEIKLADALDATGEALLTSSAADEVALESKEIRGSFFTHHLVSGLRGAADASGDGRVTLAEAYDYAFSHTLAATMQTGMAQHPAYEYRISGQGDLVLSALGRPTATLELPEGFDRALVVLVKRDQVLAELTSDTTRRLAVRPGEYAVRIWKGGRTFAGRVQVGEGQTRVVAWSDLASVTAPSVAAKGAPSGDGGGDHLDDLTPEARAEYDQKFLEIGESLDVVGTHGNIRTEHNFDAYQGKYRKKLKEPEFFRTVGRTDLAESYEARQASAYVLFGAGTAVILGGVVWGFAGEFSGRNNCNNVNDPGFSDCVTNKVNDLSPFWKVGGGIALGGAMWVAAFVVHQYRHPAEADEMRRLTDQHNETLHRRLATPRPPAAPPTSTATVRASLRFVPFAGAQGGGLGFSGRF